MMVFKTFAYNTRPQVLRFLIFIVFSFSLKAKVRIGIFLFSLSLKAQVRIRIRQNISGTDRSKSANLLKCFLFVPLYSIVQNQHRLSRYVLFVQIFGPGKKLGSLIIFTLYLLLITSSISMQVREQKQNQYSVQYCISVE